MDKRPAAYSRAFYILTFASECQHRYSALRRSLEWLQSYRCPRLTIVLVVADNTQAAWIKELQSWVDFVVFHKAPQSSAHFCRSAYLNAGANHVTDVLRQCSIFRPQYGKYSTTVYTRRGQAQTRHQRLTKRPCENESIEKKTDAASVYLWFADADIVIVGSGGGVDLQCRNVPRGAIVSPFRSVHDAPQQSAADVAALSESQICQFPSRCGLSFSGGILGMPYEAWHTFGCRWDEEFKGWGFEDAAMDTVVHRICAAADSRFSVQQWPFAALHLWHPHADHSEEMRSECAQQLQKSRALFEQNYPTHCTAFAWMRDHGIVL